MLYSELAHSLKGVGVAVSIRRFEVEVLFFIKLSSLTREESQENIVRLLAKCQGIDI